MRRVLANSAARLRHSENAIRGASALLDGADSQVNARPLVRLGEGSYSVAEVCRILGKGMTSRKVHYWLDTGLVTDVSVVRGRRGVPTILTFRQLLEIRTVQYLRDSLQVDLRKVRDAFEWVLEQLFDRRSQVVFSRGPNGTLIARLDDGEEMTVPAGQALLPLQMKELTRGAKLWWLSDLASGRRPTRTGYSTHGISATGKLIAVAAFDGDWVLIDARTGRELAVIDRGDHGGWSITHLSDDRLIVNSRDGAIAAVSLEDPFPTVTPARQVSDEKILQTTATDELIFLGADDGHVHVLDALTTAPVCPPLSTQSGSSDYVTALAVATMRSGRQRLLVGTRKYNVLAYWVDEFLADNAIDSVDAGNEYNSVEGEVLLTGTRNSVDMLVALDTAAGEVVVAADGNDNYLIHEARVSKGLFSSPVIDDACQIGELLVTAHADMAVRWWSLDEPAQPRLVHTLRLPSRPWKVCPSVRRPPLHLNLHRAHHGSRGRMKNTVAVVELPREGPDWTYGPG